jgi:sugar phosphate isomerase/epimerase
LSHAETVEAPRVPRNSAPRRIRSLRQIYLVLLGQQAPSSVMPLKNPPIDSLSRRRFLALSGLVPAVALLAQLTGGRALAADSARPAAVRPKPARKYPIGLELYSVRTELARDLPGTLREVSRIGYEAVEFYAPYYDWSLPYAKEVRSLMDDLGLRCYSTHNHLASFTAGEGMAKAVELNQIIGARHLILSSAGRDTKSVESWKQLCGQLSVAVTQLQPHGLSAGFHNHQTEWVALDGGQRVMDVIAANTPKEFVLQFDVGTCMEAGADPIAWIKANPGRIKSVHLKDWAPGTADENKGYKVLFGEGVSPWAQIIAAVESTGGVEYYLMEQEGSRYSEFETAQRCLDTWRKLPGKA